MGTKNPPQISKHLRQIKEDITIRICRQWQVGVQGSTFDLLIGQGTTACTLLIRKKLKKN